ncbi:uncharacterized protein LOC119745397 [Patiria miniata]|uniref:Ig-like domain-containing protein n=1 Tax=Patiria miniata TaxID=46514 RepID=A0A914BPL9_PATMI|nr:uncharacterized protein LOC119745397 [Patiria miniata]
MADPSQSVASLYGCVLICIILTLGTVSVSSQTTTVSILPEFTSEPREGDAVTLRCEALGFQSGMYFLSWVAVFPDQAKILTWQGELDSRITDPAYTVVNNATSDPSTKPEIHSLVINPASQSNNGMYTCRVLEVLNGNSYSVISSAQIDLTVYPARIFPSCSPNGAASLSEGSSVSCTVTANTTTLVVTMAGRSAPEDWPSSSLTPDPGSRLTASVTTADDGVTFNCSSIAMEFPDVTLDCQIGPLSVSSPTTAASSTDYDQTESSTTVAPAAISAGVVVAIILIILLILVAIVILAFILHRRRGRLRPLDKDRDRPTPTGASSPPPEQHPIENDKTAPPKPVPYALSKRHPSKQAPVVYSSAQGRGKVSSEDPPEGGIYAKVHKERQVPSKPDAKPVHYASVNKPRKSKKVQDMEPAHYAAVNKLKDPRESTEPAQYAAVQRNGPRASNMASRGGGLIYAELDLVKPPDSENQRPVPEEEPTVYAELANLK